MQDIIDNRTLKERLQTKYRKYLEERGLTKEQKEIIKRLKKEKKYDDIFTLYGQTVYLFNTPEKYMKKDIKKLLKNGNFEDIYSKYGASTYNGFLSKMEAIDIYIETKNSGKKFLSRTKNAFMKKVLPITTTGAIAFNSIPLVMFPIMADSKLKENARTYSEEIISYDARVSDYAKQFEKLELTDIQVIMKVMDDMWKDIKGYGTPQKDIVGFYRLDFLEPGGVGVCRNMADDVAAKLNVINPAYNARTLTVVADLEKKYKIANIKRNIYNPNSTVANDSNKKEEDYNEFEDKISAFTKSAFGNHKVVIMDIPNENLNLIVDPTNPSIGIFTNGKIYMFSTEDGTGISNPYYIQFFDGYDSQIDYQDRVKNSYSYRINIEELREKWGIEAENKALNEAREIANLALKKNMSFVSNNNYQYSRDLSISIDEVKELENGRAK